MEIIAKSCLWKRIACFASCMQAAEKEMWRVMVRAAASLPFNGSCSCVPQPYHVGRVSNAAHLFTRPT